MPTAETAAPARPLGSRPCPVSLPALTRGPRPHQPPCTEFKQQQAALLASSLAVPRDVSRAPAPAVSAWGGRAAPCGARRAQGRPREGREARHGRGWHGARHGLTGDLWLRVFRQLGSGGKSLQPLPPAPRRGAWRGPRCGLLALLPSPLIKRGGIFVFVAFTFCFSINTDVEAVACSCTRVPL